MLEVRNVREIDGGCAGNTGLVPPERKPRLGPAPELGNNPGPSRPVPDPPGDGGTELSSPILTTEGIWVGCRNLTGSTFVCGAEGPPLCTAGAVSTTTRPRLIGVDTV